VKLRPVATPAGFDLGQHLQNSGDVLRPHAECAHAIPACAGVNWPLWNRNESEGGNPGEAGARYQKRQRGYALRRNPL